MTPSTLFDPDTNEVYAPSRVYDPPESSEAASKVRAAEQLRAVLACLYAAHKALSDDEIAERCGLLRNSAGTRRGTAVKLGWVEKAGRSTTPRGNACSTWTLTADGARYVEGMTDG